MPSNPGKTEMADSVNKMSSNLHFQAMGHHKSQWKEHIAICYGVILNVGKVGKNQQMHWKDHIVNTVTK